MGFIGSIYGLYRGLGIPKLKVIVIQGLSRGDQIMGTSTTWRVVGIQ